MSKEVGIALVIVGAIGAVIGVFLMVTCTATFFGTCVRHDYSGVGILAGLGSGAMLVVGFVLLLTGRKPAIQSAFTQYAPPVPPVGIATTQGSPPSTSANCSVCGQPLAWIAAQNRWYCSRCGQYR
jgi:hypothetical protein